MQRYRFTVLVAWRVEVGEGGGVPRLIVLHVQLLDSGSSSRFALLSDTNLAPELRFCTGADHLAHCTLRSL